MQYLKWATELFAQANLPLAYVLDEDVRDEHGDEGFALAAELEAPAGAKRFVKRESNAFLDTNIGDWLREQGVDVVIITGFAAEQCVLRTYIGAEERGFKVLTLPEAIGSSRANMVGLITELTEHVTPRGLKIIVSAAQ